MARLFRRAIKDLLANRFLSTATIITIALAVLAVGTFGLLFLNAETFLNSWEKGVRLMVYLKADISKDQRLSTQYSLKALASVTHVRFISRDEGLAILRGQLKRQASLLDGLTANPLPDAFEVTLAAPELNQASVDSVVAQIETLPAVASVEYGQEWFQRFNALFNLFKMAGYVLGGVLATAAVLIVANTIRIVLYTRKEEIDIMRLVGATDSFIKAPFYLQGVIQGALGSMIGLAALYIGYLSISSQIQSGFTAGLLSLNFLSFHFLWSIPLSGMVVGWTGSFIALNQFLRA